MKGVYIETTVKTGNDVCQTPVGSLGIAETVSRIEKLNAQLAQFWSQADGWTPVAAAELLGKSRLDWQVSLSHTLGVWIDKPDTELTSGELILAWANLGSLIEGTIKLLLSVYYTSYQADIETLKNADTNSAKKKKFPHSPDGLTLDPLRKFCARA